MARRCICDRVEALLDGRPRFKTLEAGAKWLCFQLVKILASPSADGVIPFADPEQVSLLVSMRVTEVETHLETLVQTGLLAREGGTLVCPMLREIAPRTLAARRNGAAGGRPRKGETAEEMHQRRQREMILPIRGGVAEKPSETEQWSTPSAGAAPRGPSSSSLSTEISDSLVARGFVQLAKDAIAEGGLTYPRLTFEEAKAWLQLGERHGKSEAETRAIVLGAVRKQMARKDPSEVKSLRFFTALITRVIRGEERLDDMPSDTVSDSRPSAFELATEAWIQGGMRGPAPVRARAA